jgi:tetratricopeptide (TPR) repeat protein
MANSLMELAEAGEYAAIDASYADHQVGDVAAVADYLRDHDSYRTAIQLYRFCLQDRDIPELHFGLGQCLGKTYRYEEALSELRRAFPPESGRTDGLHYFAYILERNECWDEAGECYDLALASRYGDDLWTLSHHAWYLEKVGRVPDAEQAYRLVLERNPAYTGAVKRYAIFLARTGRDAEAERLLSDARARQPSNPFVLLNSLEYLLIRGKDAEFRQGCAEIDAAALPAWACVVLLLFDYYLDVLVPGLSDAARLQTFERAASGLTGSVHRDFDDLTERLAAAGGDVNEWQRLGALMLR